MNTSIFSGWVATEVVHRTIGEREITGHKLVKLQCLTYVKKGIYKET